MCDFLPQYTSIYYSIKCGKKQVLAQKYANSVAYLRLKFELFRLFEQEIGAANHLAEFIGANRIDWF